MLSRFATTALLWSILLLAACSPSVAPSTPSDVSLVQLVAVPQTCDGRLVRVIGFLRLEFEGDALYLHEQDFNHALSWNAIWADIPQDFPDRANLSMKYVLLEGIFRAADHGHLDGFGGTITAVRRAQIWSTPQKPYGLELREKHP